MVWVGRDLYRSVCPYTSVVAEGGQVAQSEMGSYMTQWFWGLIPYLCTSVKDLLAKDFHSLVLPSEIVPFHIYENLSPQLLVTFCCHGYLSLKILACRLQQLM